MSYRLMNRPRFDAASFHAKDGCHAEAVPEGTEVSGGQDGRGPARGVPVGLGRGAGLGPRLDVGPETLRKWVIQAQTDTGERTGPTSTELAEIRELRRENRDLREANEIPKAASIFFAGELDPRRR